jgi:DNA-binding MarR family transcriptional regulator
VTPQNPLPMDPIAEARRQWIEHGWSDAANGMAAVTSIMRAQQLMLATVEAALKPFGLSFARYEMLTLLSFTRGGELPMASASARLQVHPTSVTNTVDRLERDELVQRVAHPTDGRATLIRLTDAGRALAMEASAALNENVFGAPRMASDDIVDLVRILARFRRAAGDFIDPAPQPEPLL